MSIGFRLTPLVAAVGLTFVLRSIVASADPSPVPSPTAEVSPAAGATTAATPNTVIVDTFHFAYNPDPITIAPGTKVTFKNSDSVAHTITSADDKPLFDSGDMPQNTTWSHVFAKAGTYKYFCQYHSYMKGTVIVK